MSLYPLVNSSHAKAFLISGYRKQRNWNVSWPAAMERFCCCRVFHARCTSRCSLLDMESEGKAASDAATLCFRVPRRIDKYSGRGMSRDSVGMVTILRLRGFIGECLGPATSDKDLFSSLPDLLPIPLFVKVRQPSGAAHQSSYSAGIRHIYVRVLLALKFQNSAAASRERGEARLITEGTCASCSYLVRF